MEFAISLGFAGWLVVVAAAIILGVLLYLIGRAGTFYEWIVTAVGAGVGAIVASEFIIGFQTYEPVWDGLALIPALVGGLVVGTIVAVITRYVTGGAFFEGTPA